MSQQQQNSTACSNINHAKYGQETNQAWLSRIRKTQLEKMTPEQREDMKKRSQQAQQKFQTCKLLHSQAYRSTACKTNTYVGMNKEINREEQSAWISGAKYGSAFSSYSPQAPSVPGAQQQQQQGQEAPSNSTQPTLALPSNAVEASSQKRAEAMCELMEEQDKMLQTAFAPQAAELDEDDFEGMLETTSSSGGGGEEMSGEEKEKRKKERLHHHKKKKPAVWAANLDDALTSAPPVLAGAGLTGANIVANSVTESEEQKALKQLEKEPKDPEEVASKFQIFDKFAEKLATIRADLEKTATEAQKELPKLPKETITKEMKRLDAPSALGIYDSQNKWMVYMMMLTATKNSDLMGNIAETISRTIRLAATLEQSECPVCLLEFLKEGEQDDEKVERLLLGCCHSVCNVCFSQLQVMQGENVSCPLCRNDQFIEDVVQPELAVEAS